MHTIIATKIISGGNCLGKINGKTVFISGALPGETVEIEITQQKKDYDNSKVINIIKPSKYRIQPLCPFYGICGGCNLQFADEDYQQILRKTIVHDIFTRAMYHSKIEIPEIEIISGKSTEYRSRFQFHSGGLKKRGSSESISISDCPIAVPEIRQFLSSPEGQKIIQKGHTFVFGDKRVHTNAAKSKNLQKVVVAPSENTLCTVDLLGHHLKFDVQGFFQSNLDLLEKTIPFLIQDLKGNNLLDMYAGIGTLSTFAGKNFKHLTLVEHNKHAIAFADSNLQHLKDAGIQVTTIASSGEKWIKKTNKPIFDAIIIDPPRSGIEKSVLSWMCTCNAKQIRYLSCDPVTLARDAQKLCNSGYSLKRLFMLDFYPQTSHIEALAWFEK